MYLMPQIKIKEVPACSNADSNPYRSRPLAGLPGREIYALQKEAVNPQTAGLKCSTVAKS